MFTSLHKRPHKRPHRRPHRRPQRRPHRRPHKRPYRRPHKRPHKRLQRRPQIRPHKGTHKKSPRRPKLSLKNCFNLETDVTEVKKQILTKRLELLSNGYYNWPEMPQDEQQIFKSKATEVLGHLHQTTKTADNEAPSSPTSDLTSSSKSSFNPSDIKLIHGLNNMYTKCKINNLLLRLVDNHNSNTNCVLRQNLQKSRLQHEDKILSTKIENLQQTASLLEKISANKINIDQKIQNQVQTKQENIDYLTNKLAEVKAANAYQLDKAKNFTQEFKQYSQGVLTATNNLSGHLNKEMVKAKLKMSKLDKVTVARNMEGRFRIVQNAETVKAGPHSKKVLIKSKSAGTDSFNPYFHQKSKGQLASSISIPAKIITTHHKSSSSSKNSRHLDRMKEELIEMTYVDYQKNQLQHINQEVERTTLNNNLLSKQVENLTNQILAQNVNHFKSDLSRQRKQFLQGASKVKYRFQSQGNPVKTN